MAVVEALVRATDVELLVGAAAPATGRVVIVPALTAVAAIAVNGALALPLLEGVLLLDPSVALSPQVG